MILWPKCRGESSVIHHKAHCHNVRVPLPLLSCAVQAGRYDLDESALRAHNFEMYEVAARPQLEPDTKQGMVINCATYQGGRRVADIDLDQHARQTPPTVASSGSGYTSRIRRCGPQCCNASDGSLRSRKRYAPDRPISTRCVTQR
jgi:hypothetical protein